MRYNQKTVGTTVDQITPAEPSRCVCLIVSTADFFLGDAAVTAATGLLVKANIPYPIESCGELCGITATGTAVVSFLDQKYVSQGPNPGGIQ